MYPTTHRLEASVFLSRLGIVSLLICFLSFIVLTHDMMFVFFRLKLKPCASWLVCVVMFSDFLVMMRTGCNPCNLECYFPHLHNGDKYPQ